ELEVAHHALERARHAALELGELEALGARAELPGHRVIPDQGLQFHRAPGTRRVLRNCSSVSPRKCATISGFDTPLVRASFSRAKQLEPHVVLRLQCRRL